MTRSKLGRALWTSYVLQNRESAQRLRKDELKNAGKLGSWRRWHREQAILEQLPIVKRIARTESRKFAPHLDIQDFVQAGMVGLMEASGRYKPGRGGGFPQYAYFRIRGAIIDANKRKAYTEETHLSLDAAAPGSDRKPMTIADTVATSLPAADEVLDRKQCHELLTLSISALPAADRRLLRAWMEGKTIREQCAISGMSQNSTRDRIAQIQERVRVAMAECA